MLDKILQTLMFKKKVKPSELARETNIPKQTLSRIISGKSPNPHSKNLEPLADYFNVSIAQLRGEEELPSDAVDISLPNSKKSKPKTIPLLAWQQLNELSELDFSQLEETIFVSPDLSDTAFAVPMHDSSMEPLFRKGSILILDPTKQVDERSFVLVELAEAKQVVFRQMLVDADQRYLKSVSPDFAAFPMRLLNDDDKILGVLVEARQVF